MITCFPPYNFDKIVKAHQSQHIHHKPHPFAVTFSFVISGVKEPVLKNPGIEEKKTYFKTAIFATVN